MWLPVRAGMKRTEKMLMKAENYKQKEPRRVTKIKVKHSNGNPLKNFFLSSILL